MPNRTAIAPVMCELSAKLPLPARLQHLKRVRQLDVVLMPLRSIAEEITHADSAFWTLLGRKHATNGLDPSEYVQAMESAAILSQTAAEYLQFKHVSDDTIALLRSSATGLTVVTEVPQFQPLLRWQYDMATKRWPCKFHPNQRTESHYSGTMFTGEQSAFHAQMMDVVRFVQDASSSCGADCGVAVDPQSNRIVALGVGTAAQHPMMHAPMVLIDAVARSQGGGAWNEAPNVLPSTVEGFTEDNDSTAAAADPRHCVDGVAKSWRRRIHENFPDVRFGAPNALAASDRTGPYLLTGYDAYLSREPCTMCAMALTHSRVRAVYFAAGHPKGALKSLMKMHTLRALNHHFGVYHVVRD